MLFPRSKNYKKKKTLIQRRAVYHRIAINESLRAILIADCGTPFTIIWLDAIYSYYYYYISCLVLLLLLLMMVFYSLYAMFPSAYKWKCTLEGVGGLSGQCLQNTLDFNPLYIFVLVLLFFINFKFTEYSP